MAFPSRFPSSDEPQWQPMVDIYRTHDGWALKCDLAGVRLEDVGVRAEGSRITITGTRRDWVLEEGCCCYSMEISYNRFERTIDLPCDLVSPRMDLEFRNGILLIRITPSRSEP